MKRSRFTEEQIIARLRNAIAVAESGRSGEIRYYPILLDELVAKP
ncbi:hypothetical protein BLJAPNOD_06932 [Ensifer sp. M14]|nr:hypothetical protein BLJAPNOD_06932 [Ensifer sp. M14]